MAELTASGAIQSLAELSTSPPGYLKSTVSSEGTLVSATFTTPVTNGTGSWDPNATAHGPGPAFHPGTRVLGAARSTLTIHLWNQGSNSTSVEFDLNVTGWPWISAGDKLGVEVDVSAAPGVSLAFDTSRTAVVENFGPQATTQASLRFGGNANSSTKGEAPLSVATQAGLFSAGAPDNAAAVLLTFTGGPGGYASLQYDPWVTFSPTSPGGGGSPVSSPPLSETAWIAIGGVVAFAAALGAVGIYVRREPLEEGLTQAGSPTAGASSRSTGVARGIARLQRMDRRGRLR